MTLAGADSSPAPMYFRAWDRTHALKTETLRGTAHVSLVAQLARVAVDRAEADNTAAAMALAGLGDTLARCRCGYLANTDEDLAGHVQGVVWRARREHGQES